MSRAHRYARGLGAVLVAVLSGVLVPAGPARAEAGLTVTFNGGCGVRGAGAASEPDADLLSVPAEATVIFVNHLGQAATLLVDDRSAVTLRANDEVPVVFHHGPVSVKLAPPCVAVADAVAVDVEVVTAYPRAAAPTVAAPATSAATAQRHTFSKILVLVAAICVVGVSVATIRAIIAQRAIRTVDA